MKLVRDVEDLVAGLEQHGRLGERHSPVEAAELVDELGKARYLVELGLRGLTGSGGELLRDVLDAELVTQIRCGAPRKGGRCGRLVGGVAIHPDAGPVVIAVARHANRVADQAAISKAWKAFGDLPRDERARMIDDREEQQRWLENEAKQWRYPVDWPGAVALSEFQTTRRDDAPRWWCRVEGHHQFGLQPAQLPIGGRAHTVDLGPTGPRHVFPHRDDDGG